MQPDGTRKLWLDTLCRMIQPVFRHMAAGKLRQSIPVANGQPPNREQFASMEAFCRSFAGVAPWLVAKSLPKEEAALQREFLQLVRRALEQAAKPKSPDHLDFGGGGQVIVEAAFLALGLLRCHEVLWPTLTIKTRQYIIRSLKSVRRHKLPFNNWLLFGAAIEACLYRLDGDFDQTRMDYAIRQHEQWYVGDGAYSDGPYFHWDYYNSYVIQPMLLECLDVVMHAPCADQWKIFQEPMRQRARRFAEVQERLIAPDGTYPPLGRSLCYRFGTFHHLALMAWRKDLPDTLSPAQVRCSLTAVLRQTMLAPGTFDQHGWLTIGLHGEQPLIADPYNSTGSLYLASFGFLPLGLPPKSPFWQDEDEDWTAKKIWSGKNHPADHALHDGPNRCLHKA